MLKSAVSYFSVSTDLTAVGVILTPFSGLSVFVSDSVCPGFVLSLSTPVLLPQAARSRVMIKASASAVILFAFIVFSLFHCFSI